MKLKDILKTEFAIDLARDLAERQYTLNPHQTLRRLFGFAFVALLALITVIVMVMLIRSSPGDNPNNRIFFVFTSLVAAILIFGSMVASVIFLWDGFMGQYIQRLALEDLPEEASNDEFVHHGDLSMHVVSNRLEKLRDVLSHKAWQAGDFDRHLAFFRSLPAGVTARSIRTPEGREIFAATLPALSNPMYIDRFGLAASIGRMLDSVEISIDDEVVDEEVVRNCHLAN